MKIPYVSSGWKELFRPEKTGDYINDHCIVKGADGKYHLFGITGFFGGSSPVAKLFAHAPEALRDENGWHITTCGWNGYGVPNFGAVSIASLEWREEK